MKLGASRPAKHVTTEPTKIFHCRQAHSASFQNFVFLLDILSLLFLRESTDHGIGQRRNSSRDFFGVAAVHYTLKQLNDWGCKFTELRMGKPAYDLFIDDKNINSEVFFH